MICFKVIIPSIIKAKRGIKSDHYDFNNSFVFERGRKLVEKVLIKKHTGPMPNITDSNN